MSAPALADVARYRVLFADCDPMRIMYYGNYFRLFEIGRCELFRRLGHPFRTYVDQGLYLAVTATSCRYRRPARYDDEVVIQAGVTHVGKVRVTIAYAVRLQAEVLVTGDTEHVVLDDAGRPQRLPAAVRDAIAAAVVPPA
jgi:acyl-CoA thioester hydrolase